MKPFKIPTIFEAIDRVSAVAKRIGGALRNVGNAGEVGLARAERGFRKLFPVVGETTKSLLKYASAATAVGLIMGGISFSSRSLIDYEVQLRSFNKIVADSKVPFQDFQHEIERVADVQKKSTVETAAAFESIAGLNAKFADTAEGIGQVTEASILLSKASGGELQESAENLVNIMNQFNLAADQAGRAVNVIAAGEAVGASGIAQTSEAFINFGAVAKGANITLEESVGLIQVLAKFGTKASEAGNKLKGSVLRLQKAGVGYASGQFNINDALDEVQKKFTRLKTAKEKDRYLTKLFGAENITAGATLVNNIALFKEYTAGVTNTQSATTSARLATDSLKVKMEQLQASWVNIITTSDEGNDSIRTAKRVTDFLIDNLGTIVSWGSKLVITLVAIKAALVAARIAMTVWNVVLGISTALSGGNAAALATNAIALNAFNVVTKIATAAQWAWNAAMTANPIGLIIVGIGLLIGLIVAVVRKWNEWGAALSIVLGPLGFVISLIQSFRRNWDMIVDAFKNGGLIEGLKAIGRVIVDAMLMPMQQLAEIIARLTGFEWAKNAASNIALMRKVLDVNTTTDESGDPVAGTPTPRVSTRATQAQIERSEEVKTGNLSINIQDETGRAQVEQRGKLKIPIKLSSTVGAF